MEGDGEAEAEPEPEDHSETIERVLGHRRGKKGGTYSAVLSKSIFLIIHVLSFLTYCFIHIYLI